MHSNGPLHMAELKQGDQFAPTHILQLCDDTGCIPEDLPEAMDDSEGWERGSGISILMARQDDDNYDDDDLII